MTADLLERTTSAPPSRRPPTSRASEVAVQARPLATPAAAAIATGGSLWLVGDLMADPGPTHLAATALASGLLATSVLRERSNQRLALVKVLTRTISPHAGESKIRARRWEGRWVGTPGRLDISYDPRVDSAGEWPGKVIKAINTRLQREYRLISHDPRRHRLVLGLLPPRPTPEEQPVPELASRLEELVRALFGEGAKHSATWDDCELVAFDVQHKIGLRVSPHVLVRARMEQTVQAMLPGRWRAKWDLEADSVRFELRPPFPKTLARSFEEPTEAVLPYARDEDGEEIVWDMRSGSGTPHYLITGRTGTGKTVTLRTLVMEACRRGFEVWICDPKRIEFIGLKAWPNVGLHASTVPAIVSAIHQTRLEMERRYALIEDGKANPEDFPRMLLLIDEYRYLYGICNAWWDTVKPSGGKICPIFEEVFLIASLGRSAGIHLMIGTQRPDADWLGGDVRDQFGARMSMGRLSAEAARMMWGAHHVGVTVPLMTPGRGTSVDRHGKPVECQAYWTPDPTKASEADLEILAKLRPETTLHERKIVEPVELLDADGEPLPPKGTYNLYLEARVIPLSQRPDLEGYSPDPVAGHVATGETSRTEVTDPEDELEVEQSDAVEELRDLSYAPEGHMPAHSLVGCSGYLVEVDESLGLWAVIESAETDAVDEDQVCICWRSDEDGSDFGVLVVDGSTRLGVRTPLEDADEES